MLRLRERRWLDGASFDTERGSTSREGEPSQDKKSIPVQSPVSLGEDLQWWPDKVGAPWSLGGLLLIFLPGDGIGSGCYGCGEWMNSAVVKPF